MIKQLNKTLDSVGSKRRVLSKACLAQSLIDMEVVEDKVSRDKKALAEVARTMHLKRLRTQLAELKKELSSEKKLTSDQGKQIKRL